MKEIGLNKTDILNRLDLLIKGDFKNKKKYAEALDIDPGQVGAWLKKKNLPGSEHLANMAEKLNININWLLTGKGNKYLTKKIEPKTQNSYISIPLLDVIASAGSGAVVSGEHVIEDLKFRKEWFLNELKVHWQNIQVITVEGASMTPELNHGDMVFVDITDNLKLKDCIYVIRVDDHLLVKKVQVLPGKKIKIISVNPEFEPYTITLGESENFAVIGRVVWSGRKL